MYIHVFGGSRLMLGVFTNHSLPYILGTETHFTDQLWILLSPHPSTGITACNGSHAQPLKQIKQLIYLVCVCQRTTCRSQFSPSVTLTQTAGRLYPLSHPSRSTPSFLRWDLGMELRSPCVYGKHFTD